MGSFKEVLKQEFLYDRQDSPPPLFIKIILKFWNVIVPHCYRIKPISPVMNTVCFHWLQPIAVEVLPSIPLVPRLQ
jgi:hypothetical protein